jgi:hypothetical protein
MRLLLAERAREQGWTPERTEEEVSKSVEGVRRLAAETAVMRRRGQTYDEVKVAIAAYAGVTVAQLEAEAARCRRVVAGR